VCDAAWSGVAFLEDLSHVADSSYGHGCVERLLVTHDNTVQLSTNMLFITW